jgi:hypothetical protein
MDLIIYFGRVFIKLRRSRFFCYLFFIIFVIQTMRIGRELLSLNIIELRFVGLI